MSSRHYKLAEGYASDIQLQAALTAEAETRFQKETLRLARMNVTAAVPTESTELSHLTLRVHYTVEGEDEMKGDLTLTIVSEDLRSPRLKCEIGTAIALAVDRHMTTIHDFDEDPDRFVVVLPPNLAILSKHGFKFDAEKSYYAAMAKKMGDPKRVEVKPKALVMMPYFQRVKLETEILLRGAKPHSFQTITNLGTAGDSSVERLTAMWAEIVRQTPVLEAEPDR